MSRERQKARAARELARRAEVEEAARRRSREARRQAVAARLKPSPRKRQRRYGALSARARYQLVVAFFVVQALAWYLFDGIGQRFSVAVLTIAVLLVLVLTRRSTPR